MNLTQRILALTEWGAMLQQWQQHTAISEAVNKEYIYHPWSVTPFISVALQHYAQVLTPEFLHAYVSGYEPLIEQHQPKRIAYMPHGSHPLCGMEYVIPVLLTGNTMVCTPFEDHRRLLQLLLEELSHISPLGTCCVWQERIHDVQQVILPQKYAQSAAFTAYMKKYPTLTYKELYSVAELSGSETQEQLRMLAQDIMLYFGITKGSVKLILVPEHYDFHDLFTAINDFMPIAGSHNKYLNNLEYQKTLHLFHSSPFLDQGLMVVSPVCSLNAPTSVLHYRYGNARTVPIPDDAPLYMWVNGIDVPYGNVHSEADNLMKQKNEVLPFLLQ